MPAEGPVLIVIVIVFDRLDENESQLRRSLRPVILYAASISGNLKNTLNEKSSERISMQRFQDE